MSHSPERADTHPDSWYVSDPLDRDDPRVEAARDAERTAYEYYGLEFTEHYVHVPELDCRIRVTEVGDGPPIVVVPGGVGYGVIWTPLLPELDGYTVFVMDRPGGGFSDGFDHQVMPLAEIAATSTAAVFDHFTIDEAPIVANSMGGLWGLRFTLEHPDRVSEVALLGCPALYPDTSAPLPMRLLSIPGFGRLLVEPVMQADDSTDARKTWEFLGHPEGTATGLPGAFAEAWYRMDNLPHFGRSWASLLRQAVRLRGAVPESAFTLEELGNVRPPVLLLWGSDDPFGSPATGRRGAEYIPDATFYEVGAGHLPWLDDSAACGELLRKFIDRGNE